MSREIALTQGKVAIVDDAHFDLLSKWKWHAHRNGNTWYARRQETIRSGGRSVRKQRPVLMHRVIAGAPDSLQVDHRNGDGLDNRAENLRICSAQENQRNKRGHRLSSSGFKGVSWHRRMNRWAAGMTVDGRRVHLGYFEHEEAAARAYDAAAVSRYGAFARTNFQNATTEAA